MFVVGRELESYDQFWDDDKRFPDNLARCVDVFLTLTHRARVAALQTVSALPRRGLPRDVAVLIARSVYATREDAFAWRTPQTPATQTRRVARAATQC